MRRGRREEKKARCIDLIRRHRPEAHLQRERETRLQRERERERETRLQKVRERERERATSKRERRGNCRRFTVNGDIDLKKVKKERFEKLRNSDSEKVV